MCACERVYVYVYVRVYVCECVAESREGVSSKSTCATGNLSLSKECNSDLYMKVSVCACVCQSSVCKSRC